MGYKVLVDEFTVHRDLRELKDRDGRVTGRQLGLGKIYVRDEVVPDNHVAQVYKDALEDEDNEAHAWVSERLEQVGDEPSTNLAVRLNLPFQGYEEMGEDDIVAAMRHLPSSAIQSVKQYEATLDEPRDKIIHYNIGYGSDPDARQEGRTKAASDEISDDERTVAAEDKATAKLTTRDVPEEGEVTHGEGYTGTGEGVRPYGEGKSEEGDEKPKKAARNRRGRRDRPQQSSEPASGGE